MRPNPERQSSVGAALECAAVAEGLPPRRAGAGSGSFHDAAGTPDLVARPASGSRFMPDAKVLCLGARRTGLQTSACSGSSRDGGWNGSSSAPGSRSQNTHPVSGWEATGLFPGRSHHTQTPCREPKCAHV